MRFSRLFLIQLTLVGATIAGILISLPLFFTERGYPLIPIIPNILLPTPWDSVALILFGLCLIAILLKPKAAWPVISALVLLLFIILFDYTRLQPWIYQYGWMFLILAVTRKQTMAEDSTLKFFRFLVIATYAWSGIQKLNAAFIETGFPWLVSPIVTRLPESIQMHAYNFGIIAPLFELAIAIGLTFKKTRTASIVGAICMHLLILFSLGPFGHNTNSVVWPWNIAMISFVVILFWKTSESASDIAWVKKSTLQKILLIFFGILPLFSFSYLWDSYLSMALYSSNTKYASISIPETMLAQIPYPLATYAVHSNSEMSIIPVVDWSFGELRVPAYPEIRVYKQIARDICSKLGNPTEVQLSVYRSTSYLFPFPTKYYSCADVQPGS